MELHNTLERMPLKVSILGDPKVGKETFLKSLSLAEPSDDSQQVFSLSVNDLKNNVMTVFHFR